MPTRSVTDDKSCEVCPVLTSSSRFRKCVWQSDTKRPNSTRERSPTFRCIADDRSSLHQLPTARATDGSENKAVQELNRPCYQPFTPQPRSRRHTISQASLHLECDIAVTRCGRRSRRQRQLTSQSSSRPGNEQLDILVVLHEERRRCLRLWRRLRRRRCQKTLLQSHECMLLAKVLRK